MYPNINKNMLHTCPIKEIVRHLKYHYQALFNPTEHESYVHTKRTFSVLLTSFTNAKGQQIEGYWLIRYHNAMHIETSSSVHRSLYSNTLENCPRENPPTLFMHRNYMLCRFVIQESLVIHRYVIILSAYYLRQW